MRDPTGTCVDCDQPSVGRALRCAACQQRNEYAKRRAYYEANREKCLEASRKYKSELEKPSSLRMDPWKGRDYVIVRDPLPVDDGGFKPGAQFSKYELTYMARFGTISAGATLKNSESGSFYVVDQGHLVRR